MVKQIDKLTDEQIAQMKPWADKWIKIGLCTDPANRPRAEAAYRKCYKFSGLKDDIPIIWVDSPYIGALVAPLAAIRLEKNKDNSNPLDIINKAVQDVIDDNIDEQLYWHYRIGGSFWAARSAYESFFRVVCDLELENDLVEKAEAGAETVKNGCYWWPNEDFIVACERPCKIHLDDVGRLHNETGKAIEWPGGWGIYSWKGVKIPADLIEKPETITPTSIQKEENAEIRRVMIEIYGFERFITDAKMELIGEDLDLYERPRKLWRKNVGDEWPLTLVDVMNGSLEPDGTRRRYIISVPHEYEDSTPINTPHAAIAWSFGMKPEEYKTEFES